ncbi:MAG: integron [Pseudomonadota bacterium]
MIQSIFKQIKRFGAVSTLTLALVAPQVVAAQSVPVRLGLDGPEFDACGGFGEVYRLNPNGDNYLSVRNRPSGQGRELDRLGPKQGVWMCETRGRWIGVVYSKGGQDCFVSSPTRNVRNYNGPCPSGWVFDKYIKLIAG